MKRKTLIFLYIQYYSGRLCSLVLAPAIFLVLKLMRYRIHELKGVRKRIRQTMREHRGPWIVCANHLTMIDSVLLIYAMAPMHDYIRHYRSLAWNLPEKANFYSNIMLRVLCYLSKCIPIIRGGDRNEMKETLNVCIHLLKRGEPMMIFPEGTRSRTGCVNVNGFSYGVGRFIAEVPDSRVLCLYMRGDGQKSYSSIPRYREWFTVLVDSLKPETHLTGLKAHRECARQIVERLAHLERHYFDTYWKRHRRSHNPSCNGEEPRLALS